MTKSENVGSKPSRHSRKDVVAAALRILDEYGLPDLTMRRLGATLDVQPSALYWHFANKQTLLASVADEIVARPAASRLNIDDLGHRNPASHTSSHQDSWQSATRAESFAIRDSLLAFRDGAEVVSSTLALGLGAGLPLSRLCKTLTEGGFDSQTSSVAGSALLHFILGHVWHEQQRLQADSLGVVSQTKAVDPADAAHPRRDRDAFAFGITLLLEGLELHRLASHELDPSAKKYT